MRTLIVTGFIIIAIVMTAFVLTGCANIRHKVFRTVISGTGGKISVSDPSGSGNPFPNIILGAYTQSITTVPPGTKAQYSAESYELFSGRLLYKESMKIDSTLAKPIITDKKVDYSADCKPTKKH